jgi:chromosome segregation protein
MYLRRLDLHGFKSFARKTSFGFSPGITAIVGPNGCGKSNVIDAVRWVLGEQRARLLRSDKMESVIFNGTADKRPLGMAEVSLTIDNNRGVLPIEYAEVTVARRLFRSGDSEYLLNNAPCRLKDILDLFMDTGLGPGAYSVIELKMIEDILSETAADRRRLFEEAAGVTKYKLRRRQALQKLEATQADLTRLRDLGDEVSSNDVRAAPRPRARGASLLTVGPLTDPGVGGLLDLSRKRQNLALNLSF